jgi:hypothetical protein
MPSPETRDLAPPSVISGPTAKEDYADRSEALELQALIEEAQNNLSEVISDQDVFRSKSTELNSNFLEMGYERLNVLKERLGLVNTFLKNSEERARRFGDQSMMKRIYVLNLQDAKAQADSTV